MDERSACLAGMSVLGNQDDLAEKKGEKEVGEKGTTRVDRTTRLEIKGAIRLQHYENG
jgi:hypothetical protein